MKETVETIKTKLLIYGVLSLVAFAPPFISLLIDIRPESESISTWFQRSGSIMVIIAIWVEFKLLSLEGYICPSGTAYSVPFNTPKYYTQIYKAVSFVAISAAISGTLIWGYGDIVFN